MKGKSLAKIPGKNTPEKNTFKCSTCGREMLPISTTNRLRVPLLVE